MQHEGSASVVLRFSACAAANEKKGHVALVAGARRRWWTRSRAPDRRTRRTMSVACSSHVRRQPDEEEDAEEEEVEEDEPEEKRQRAAGSGACGGACGRERSELLGFYLCKHETLDTHGGDSPGCIGLTNALISTPVDTASWLYRECVWLLVSDPILEYVMTFLL
ncbi:hypothetical protein HZH66_008175 [Vespula vulgaris]|uniref:Uncharacterized protein n=1 Tax=Vespula vulgaris TaxID=7454 RepID=A0A834JV58_VESVU|nr:hypothetical protein HZH66_008175 [Vespula vulgaris]